jgi:HEAT repeat protein
MGTRPGKLSTARGVKTKGRKGVEESGRGILKRLYLSFLFLAFLASFAVNSSAQDLDSLALALRSGTSEQKRDALFQIRNLQTEQASRVAIPALKDADEMVRATATSAVVYLPPDEAAQALIPLLNDQKPFVRKEAAYALGDVEHWSATDPLLSVMRNDKDAEVRTAAVIAIGKLGDLDAINALTAILKRAPKEDEEMFRRATARSIGQMANLIRTGNTHVITPQNFLPDEFKSVGNRNALKPGRIKVDLPPIFAVLTAVLKNKKEADDTRREAAFALGAFGDSSAVGILESHLNSPDPYLAEISKEALLKLAK